jgi:hypothetical protein
VPRGAIFLFISAKAMATIEFLQQEWINDGNFIGVGDESDPIIGRKEEGATFTIPQRQSGGAVHGIRHSNVLRGGEYFFLPSISALKWLANRHDTASQPRRKRMATQPAHRPAGTGRCPSMRTIQQLRELFATAPIWEERRCENVLRELTSQVSQPLAPPVASAGRIGIRLGKVSELTVIAPFAPGGAQRLRALLRCSKAILTARTRLAPSTTCASSFWTTTRNFSSPLPSTATGTPTSTTSRPRSPTTWTHELRVRRLAGDSQPKAKDYLAKHQITAEGWFVANPDLTVAETRGLKRNGRR